MCNKVLIAEDSSSMRKMINFTLVENGFEVKEVKNGKEALDQINNECEKFKLIITDINMPVLNGLELIKELRNHPVYKFTPIIVITTESEEDIRTKGKLAGATAWLVKPFNPEHLLNTVNKVIG